MGSHRAGYGECRVGLTHDCPPAVNRADCPEGWYWDNDKQNCLPPGAPKDPPMDA